MPRRKNLLCIAAGILLGMAMASAGEDDAWSPISILVGTLMAAGVSISLIHDSSRLTPSSIRWMIAPLLLALIVCTGWTDGPVRCLIAALWSGILLGVMVAISRLSHRDMEATEER